MSNPHPRAPITSPSIYAFHLVTKNTGINTAGRTTRATVRFISSEKIGINNNMRPATGETTTEATRVEAVAMITVTSRIETAEMNIAVSGVETGVMIMGVGKASIDRICLVQHTFRPLHKV